MTDALFREGELPPAPSPLIVQAVQDWNECATAETGWPKIDLKRSTPTRQKRIQKAVTECGGLIPWRALLKECTESAFLTARTPQRFALTVDWLCKPDNLTKVLDGNYKNRNGAPSAPDSRSPQQKQSDAWYGYIKNYKRGGWWPSQLGPRPEDPDCKAPAHMVEAWRRENKVEVVARPVESRETKLAAMVVSYRRLGRWKDANRAESELAALEGRAPVHVPDPAVAHLGTETKPEPRASKVGSAVFDADTGARQSAADLERERRTAFEAANTPPEWDGVPEGDYEVEGPEDD